MARTIVSTDWLYQHQNAPDVVIVHAILEFEKTNDELRQQYADNRIPGAILFDIDEVADSNNPLPHMLPPSEKFSSIMRKMGVGDGQKVIVYDAEGNFCASRVWWMFRTFGVRDVRVLDGGLPKWIAEGKPVSDGQPRPRQERHFTSRFQSMCVRDMEDVAAALSSKTDQVLDARSHERFTGQEEESREGLRSGHMPGSFNIYYHDVMNEDCTMKSPEELRTVFENSGLDLSKPIITTCGSGVTAAILSLALEMIGHRDHPVYDGSWTEWAGDASSPVVQG